MSGGDVRDHVHVVVEGVEAHRAQLMARLNIHNVPGLVRLALRAESARDGVMIPTALSDELKALSGTA